MSNEAVADAEAVVGELADATAILHHAREKVEAANTHLRSRLDSARHFARASRARLERVREHWDAESATVRASVAETRTKAAARLAALDDTLGDATDRGDALEQLITAADHRVSALASATQTRAQEGHDSLSEHIDALEHAFAAVEKAAAVLQSEGERALQEVHDELHAWLGEANQHSHQLVEALTSLGSHGHSRSNDIATALQAATSAKLAILGHTLLTQAIADLTSATGDAQQALDVLGAGADEHHEHLTDGIDDVLAQVKDVLAVIERLRPLLEQIHHMLT